VGHHGCRPVRRRRADPWAANERPAITEGFTNKPDALVDNGSTTRSFDQGAGTPAVIITNVSQQSAVMAAAGQVKGVATGPAQSAAPDYTKLAAAIKAAAGSGATPPVSTGGCLPKRSMSRRSTGAPSSTPS